MDLCDKILQIMW